MRFVQCCVQYTDDYARSSLLQKPSRKGKEFNLADGVFSREVLHVAEIVEVGPWDSGVDQFFFVLGSDLRFYLS